MKNLFKLIFVTALLVGSFGFANIKSSNVLHQKNIYPNLLIGQKNFNNQYPIHFFKYGCKTFHIKVSIKFIEIETDVTVCAGCTKYMAVTCGGSISKNNNEDLSFGGMDLTRIMSDERFTDATEIEVLQSSSETSDGITLTVKRGIYKIEKDENGYGTIVNLE